MRATRFLRSSQLPPAPPENLTERAMTFMQRIVATGLVFASAGGLAFVLAGCYEIYDRNTKKKRLKEQEAAAGK